MYLNGRSARLQYDTTFKMTESSVLQPFSVETIKRIAFGFIWRLTLFF